MKKLLLILVLSLFTFQCERGWLNEIINPTVLGCKDSTACNYNSDATEDDGSCIARQGCNGWCYESGNIYTSGIHELDCAGECGGNAVYDDCGICDGNPENDNTILPSGESCMQDCLGEWDGNAEEDLWGQCCENGIPEGICSCEGMVEDCAGECGGDAVDSNGNGICDSDETNETDCSDPNTCSNCEGCDGSCCPNYCSGNYYYYNRSCSNGFCVGATSDYCSDGCNADGCIESTYGCTNPSACNFDATATIFDDSCWSATEGCACSDGEGSVADDCGTCDTDSTNDCVQDCAGDWGGDNEGFIVLWDLCFSMDVVVISLSGYPLTGEIPSGIGNLINLDSLALDNNNLTGSIPPEVGSLTNLHWLHLNNNQLTGEIPPEVCDLIENNNLWMPDILEGNSLINTCE